MYPFMTGLVAGAFVLSSLYHVFGIKPLRDIARFALVFSSPAPGARDAGRTCRTPTGASTC